MSLMDEGDCSLNYWCCSFNFDGHVKADDGGLGKSVIQFNADDGDEMMADVIWSAMIDEGNDCGDNRLRG